MWIVVLFVLAVLPACSSQREEASGVGTPAPKAASKAASRPASRPAGQPTAEDVGFCGGIAGFECDAGQYCAYPVGTCKLADRAGKCEVQPQICTMDYDPVCGCDGQTYSNACSAAAKGVSLQGPGACGKPQ